MDSTPRTEDSTATIALGPLTVMVLGQHFARRDTERRAADSAPPLERVSAIFRWLSREAGLPPINLRDLRHVAATLIHAGGGDLHTIKETLRHGTIQLASDTYTSLLPQVDQEVARNAESVVPRVRRETPSGTPAHAPLAQGPVND